MLKNLAYKVMFIGWMVFVTLLSLFSFSGVEASRFNIPHLDKAVHFTFYFVMVVLAFFAKTNGAWHGSTDLKILRYIVLFAIGYGIIIEILQHVATMDRQGDPFDVLANSIGAFTGMMLLRFLFLIKQSLK
ncbi:VanZ family protein [Maribacter sp. X9]|uniref:VanZ family protein n=1 Tax=Maribacter sp. X9 TaxID=3402159 RepID=UPI003AF39CB2